jgi:hypothetical protein
MPCGDFARPQPYEVEVFYCVRTRHAGAGQERFGKGAEWTRSTSLLISEGAHCWP